ncbi:dienelactone hydrolase family protein [Streptococcus sp. 29896]|uniref:Dienelactone hydrolase family protein n=1 Tax=Streptococcus suivaginalis TaxID=3028082 RepID=A0AA97A110_9STRE|nr:dienelactone hydrolase family protein [Streptococcus sp. 29896]WNY48034.1 dienelactone hydrolase family protein [Streptococcus sp. 29896]
MNKMKEYYLQGENRHLLVLFHGTGGDETSLLFMRKLLDPSASILSFQGTWSDQGRMRRFFKPLINGQLDQEDFEERIQDFFQNWRERDLSSYDKISLIGFSNGANFVIGLLAKGIESVNQVLLLHPSALSYPLPIISSQLPILMTAGRNDEMINLKELEKLCEAWKIHAFENLTLWLFNGGHFLTEPEKEVLIQWYRDEKIT